MNTYFTEAFLLRATPFEEADVVAALLTPTQGRIAAVARGARKSRRRFGGAMDYFCLMRAEIRPSRSGMAKLLGVELVASYEKIRNDVDLYAAGSHLLEVARLATREGDLAPEPYLLLRSSMELLDAGAERESLLRVFQIRMLAALGYGLSGEFCSRCGEEIAEGSLAFREYAPVCAACSDGACRPISPGARKTLSAAAALPLERLGALRIGRQLDEELRPLVVGALVHALGFELKSLKIDGL